MRFDELDLEEEILQGIEAMNFQEMTPVQEQTIPDYPRRKRHYRLRPNRNRKNSRLHTSFTQPFVV